ncbi:MAG TPA: peptidase S10 [Terriglobia bacterium]|nr:peptidase S10 [Terriglobia bacterium]
MKITTASAAHWFSIGCGILFVIISCAARPALAQRRGSEQAARPAPAEASEISARSSKESSAKNELPPLPPNKSIEQSTVLDGQTLDYKVTVGAINLRDPNGKIAGKVVYTAYTIPGKDRPVTFAFNGGPGASSVFLNFGAIGPKHLDGIGNKGDSASGRIVMSDNQGTWLDFTDLVFIDPVGTGFSRSLVSEPEAKKLFYSTVPDIQYLSTVVYKWLVQNGRMTSPKYIIGESYGGFRGPRLTYYLQSQLGVGINGLILVSPYLNPTDERNGYIYSPIPWMVTLPPIVAAHLEREGKLTPEAMQSVIAYDEGPYATALIAGNSKPALEQAMIQKVTQMTGLDPTYVKESGGRLETGSYLREVRREQGKIGSVYDSNVTMLDPFPWTPEQRANDPILASIIAPTTEAMVNFVTNVVGWKTDAPYHTLSYEVAREWSRDLNLRSGSVTQLRQAVAADPALKVFIGHGWNDLSCPFMGSILSVNQMPDALRDRISVHEFPGGHMFYTRNISRIAFRKAAKADLFSTE